MTDAALAHTKKAVKKAKELQQKQKQGVATTMQRIGADMNVVRELHAKSTAAKKAANKAKTDVSNAGKVAARKELAAEKSVKRSQRMNSKARQAKVAENSANEKASKSKQRKKVGSLKKKAKTAFKNVQELEVREAQNPNDSKRMQHLARVSKSARLMREQAEHADIKMTRMKSDAALARLRESMKATKRKVVRGSSEKEQKKAREDAILQKKADERVNSWFKNTLVKREETKNDEEKEDNDDLGEGEENTSVDVNKQVDKVMYNAEVEFERSSLDNLAP